VSFATYQAEQQWSARTSFQNQFSLRSSQIPYHIVTESINFIEETDDQPFLLQASIPGPHDLEQVPAPYRNMFPPESAPVRSAGDELNKVTQSGNQKMVRMEDWKLVYDMIGLWAALQSAVGSI